MPNAVVEPLKPAEAGCEPLSYGSYLEVPGLLTLQRPRTSAHDEMLFIVTHQAIELWFRCVLHELEDVREALTDERFGQARRGLRRVMRIVALVLDHVDVLTTMTPAGFNEFRDVLGESSGFQSVQFRELEMLSGMRDRRYLNLPGATAAERERLQLRFQDPSLHDVFTRALERRGLTPSSCSPLTCWRMSCATRPRTSWSTTRSSTDGVTNTGSLSYAHWAPGPAAAAVRAPSSSAPPWTSGSSPSCTTPAAMCTRHRGRSRPPVRRASPSTGAPWATDPD